MKLFQRSRQAGSEPGVGLEPGDDLDAVFGAAVVPWRVRPRLRLGSHRATTAHSCSIYPWGVHASLGNRGPLLGRDLLAGGSAFHFDPFETYAAPGAGRHGVTNTNMMILGQPGIGKSALVKTWLARTAAIYGSARFVAVVDVKGEYQPLAGV